MRIEVDIRGYWRAGTGAGETGSVDALCATDHLGLPYLPGRHLKGLLRDAVDQFMVLRGGEESLTHELFGGEGTDKETGQTVSEAGMLRVDSAHLPVGDREAILAANDREALTRRLFRTLQSTAIRADTGAAKNKSLRMEQVAIPLVLEFEVTGALGGDWEGRVKSVLPLIRAVGQKRTRGLGRARLRCVS